MPAFSPHTRGYKSMLSRCYLSTKQLPRSFMVHIHRKLGLAFQIDPCYAESRRVGTPREPEISGQEKAEAEGLTFANGEGSQPAHHFFRAGLGSLAFVMPGEPGARSFRPRVKNKPTPVTRPSPYLSSSGVTLHSSPSFICAIEHSSRITTRRSSIRWWTDHGSIVLR